MEKKTELEVTNSRVEQVLRKPAVLAALGWSNATLYARIKEGRFPPGLKLDPNSNMVCWLASDIEKIQQDAVARCRGQKEAV